jgi:alkyl hydroperoxide reductase subunit AhpC
LRFIPSPGRRFETCRWPLGISIDSVPAKIAWAKSLGDIETLDLLSDFYPHGAVADRYGVLRPEGFSERAIFIVDADGKIVWAKQYDIGQVPETAEVLKALED